MTAPTIDLIKALDGVWCTPPRGLWRSEGRPYPWPRADGGRAYTHVGVDYGGPDGTFTVQLGHDVGPIKAGTAVFVRVPR